jgi:hypothetical protein
MAYSKGKIYKIYNIDETDKFYVGSTIDTIWRRFYGHKTKSKKATSFFYQEVRRLGWNKFKIEVIEQFPCNNKQELFAEEERIRSETDAFYNTNRTYLNDEQRKLYYKARYEDNKEKIRKQQMNTGIRIRNT